MQELIKFSDVVYKLAQEEEPHPARISFLETLKQKEKRAARKQNSTVTLDSKTNHEAEQAMRNTLVSSLKDKYIVRSRFNTLGNPQFKPPNPGEAKEKLKSQVIHNTEDYTGTQASFMKTDGALTSYLHGISVFKSTSPVTQDIL